jgi:(p)ppGpp synthase/HD superfamily hydrolase
MDQSSVISVVQARELAVRAHADQRDRDGSFHIAHVARVAEGVPGEAPYQRVAWLHDAVEDCALTVEELPLPDAERGAIALLTHDEREPYQQYIERLVMAAGQAGVLARSVKEADMLDNLRRCAEARDEAVAQYGRALARLRSAGQG